MILSESAPFFPKPVQESCDLLELSVEMNLLVPFVMLALCCGEGRVRRALEEFAVG